EQGEQTRVLFDSMKAKAVDLGTRLVEKERRLDQMFAGELIDAMSLRTALSEISAIQAELRYVHLHAHLAQKALLTRQQIELYDQLRGYSGASAHGNGHDHGH
ncbi:MAG: hypothetical protein MJA83_17105, partial [Gammaproteobacteria bacterium]|nr:hypothetical protein [Gammaproteobacteria bacterium]